jgi:hypothetical protein
MDFGEIFRTLRPKFTRWDCVSLAIFGALAYVAVEGFGIIPCTFAQLLILVAVLFLIALILLVVEPTLKRLWSKKRG